MRKRKILEMSPEELRALTAIVLPGRKGDELKIGDMQEMCIKWLFANGLSINHVFEILEDPNNRNLFCVMRNNDNCSCCPKASEKGVLTEFDRGPIGEKFKRTPSPARRPKFEISTDEPPRSRDPRVVPPPAKSRPLPSPKISPVTVQPTIVTIEDSVEKEEREKKKTCGYCRRECGLCIVNLCSQF